ncbi:hypothetical protein [Dokdonella sp.]|uniref:hypothetical protein n=1 Tax=Dokdonella sp. TaxID=2291710 RepID=UPI003529785E
MLRKLIVLFAVTFVPAFALAAASGDELTTTVQWKMHLDPEGRITALEPKGSTIDAVRQKLEPVVRSWSFVPGTVNGEPAGTDTLLSVQVTLAPLPDGEQFSLRIDDARTGGFVADASTPPRFPAKEVRKLLDGDGYASFFYEVGFDHDGVPTSVVLAHRSGATKGSLGKLAEEAVRSWTYEPERVAGVGVPGSVVVPVCFSVGSSPRSAQRNSSHCRWNQPGSKAAVEEGQSLALESSASLKSDVVGRVL